MHDGQYSFNMAQPWSSFWASFSDVFMRQIEQGMMGDGVLTNQTLPSQKFQSKQFC